MRFVRSRSLILAPLLAAVVLPAAIGWGTSQAGELRTWSDDSGKFSVEAEFVTAKDGRVRLKREDGKLLNVPLERLSAEDQAFIEAELQKNAGAAPEAALEVLPDLARDFFEDLRTTERTYARGLLTAKAQEQNKAAEPDAKADAAKTPKSPLFALPTPDEGAKSIRVGKPKLDDTVAEVPVQVRTGGETTKVALHLRHEEGEWRVYAISATLDNEQLTIDFEAPIPQGQASSVEQLVGQKFELHGITMQGGRIDMSQYAGKVVLVDFWATWCKPCLAEMPNVLANYQQYHDAGFEVVAVSVDEDLDQLQKFVAENNPPWTVVVDRHPQNVTPMGAKYNLSGIPTFVLVDRDGTVAAVNCRGDQLGQELAKLLGDGKDKPDGEPDPAATGG